MVTAADLAADHHFGIWDAVILSTASQTGLPAASVRGPARRLYLGGVAVANPFAAPHHALLDAFLGAG